MIWVDPAVTTTCRDAVTEPTREKVMVYAPVGILSRRYVPTQVVFGAMQVDADVVVRVVIPLAIRTVTPPTGPPPSRTVPLIVPVDAVRSTINDSLRLVLRKTTLRTTVE